MAELPHQSNRRRIYVASSWRCAAQPEVVGFLRAFGHEVYDFRHPQPGDDGFKWSAIDPDWIAWDASEFRRSLKHPTAAAGFANDMNALRWCDTCVLVLPCGRSAHLELGWAAGAGKLTIAVLTDGEPELMYLMVDHLVTTRGELLDVVGDAREAGGNVEKDIRALCDRIDAHLGGSRPANDEEDASQSRWVVGGCYEENRLRLIEGRSLGVHEQLTLVEASE